jgi:hypothetical protein
VLLASGDRNLIGGNRSFGGDAGIGVEDGSRNVVARNVVTHTSGAGIYLGLKRPEIGGSHNVLLGNRVKAGGIDGFAVRRADHHSVLRHNTALGARDDGFDVASRTAKLGGNRAFRNGDLGIEAARGVIDLGGNSAGRNGDPRQCKHIACS